LGRKPGKDDGEELAGVAPGRLNKAYGFIISIMFPTFL